MHRHTQTHTLLSCQQISAQICQSSIPSLGNLSTLSWWRGLRVPMNLRAVLSLVLLVGSPMAEWS